MKKIGIIYKKEDKLVCGTAEKLKKELSSGFFVFTDQSKMHHADFIITLGGDGTVLRASRFSSLYKIPLLTVHMGGLGLLTEISINGISSAIENIKANKYSLDKRSMLKVLVLRNGKKIKEYLALNDAVICKREIARTIRLRAYSKNTVLADYVSDGLIASTATGSTAYNFAVMGPILPPHAKQYALSPICPHRATNRSIVLDDPTLIEIVKGDEVLLTADGQETFVVKPKDIIEISMAKEQTSFIRFKDYDLWGLLRQKIGW